MAFWLVLYRKHTHTELQSRGVLIMSHYFLQRPTLALSVMNRKGLRASERQQARLARRKQHWRGEIEYLSGKLKITGERESRGCAKSMKRWGWMGAWADRKSDRRQIKRWVLKSFKIAIEAFGCEVNHQKSFPICMINTVHMQIGLTQTPSLVSVTHWAMQRNAAS